jgi:hypothetical protein
MTSRGEVMTGDNVRFDGRQYIVRGFTYASSPTQHVVLRTGRRASSKRSLSQT